MGIGFPLTCSSCMRAPAKSLKGADVPVQWFMHGCQPVAVYAREPVGKWLDCSAQKKCILGQNFFSRVEYKGEGIEHPFAACVLVTIVIGMESNRESKMLQLSQEDIFQKGDLSKGEFP